MKIQINKTLLGHALRRFFAGQYDIILHYEDSDKFVAARVTKDTAFLYHEVTKVNEIENNVVEIEFDNDDTLHEVTVESFEFPRTHENTIIL